MLFPSIEHIKDDFWLCIMIFYFHIYAFTLMYIRKCILPPNPMISYIKVKIEATQKKYFNKVVNIKTIQSP